MEPISIVTVAAVTVGLVEVLKRTAGVDKVVEGRVEITALLISVVLGYFYGLDILSGILAGLSSMGLYDAGSESIAKVRSIL